MSSPTPSAATSARPRRLTRRLSSAGAKQAGRFIPAFGADSVTVNGYLGSDGVKPFADLCKKYDKGIFVLVKTSNPSSCEVQDLVADGGPLYERMGELCADWGGAAQGYSDIGAVIGATWPEQLGLLRRKLAHTFFLVPGYGAQGGGADDAAPAFDSAGGRRGGEFLEGRHIRL
jgi:orotidine-5'-phosphate decarboxylase